MYSSRLVVDRVANKLIGTNNSVAWALEQLFEDSTYYCPVAIEKQLLLQGYARCGQCFTLIYDSQVTFSGGECLCSGCV
jgi:formylmethanofuran dehydrogenase subunit E